MRVLVLGADGMVGHAVAAGLASGHEVHGTCALVSCPALTALVPGAQWHPRIDAQDTAAWQALLARLRPTVVINALGLIKQRPLGGDPMALMTINGRFPHVLADLADTVGAKVVQISTDCVFSGRRGNYAVSDVPDPIDAYGESKLAGELTRAPHLTLRSSVVGCELRPGFGLLEWFLARAQRGAVVRGFVHAVFSGLTNHAFAALIGRLLERHSECHGVLHVAAEPISKHDLLVAVRDQFALTCEIVPDDSLRCDRSLLASDLLRAAGIGVPSWPAMIGELSEWLPRYVALRTP